MAKELNDENFESGVASGVALVDFTATWCGPCRMLAPIIEELATQLEGQATVAKVDIDQSQETAKAFNVTSVPTIVLMKDGKEIDRVVGLRDADTLKEMVTAQL